MFEVNRLEIQEHSNNSLKKLLTSETCLEDDLLHLSKIALTDSLVEHAFSKKQNYYPDQLTYSPKVFIPLTFLCRDVCHYCTFAKTPKKVESPYLSIEEVIRIAKEGEEKGCHEALFTLGDKPELRYKAARDALAEMGYQTTNEYVAACAKAVLEHTSLIPHLNPGCLTEAELDMLKPLSGSMGLMVESLSANLCKKGQPHYGSPDKEPIFRMQTLINAGKRNIPFTTGILIGIGETRLERLESIFAIAELHKEYGHIQEVIVQNFKAKANTLMEHSPEPSFDELIWTIAMARLILPGDISLQVPPNLNPQHLERLIESGINDFGGISPVTKDFVNPEAPWPEIKKLTSTANLLGQDLRARATLYPAYFKNLALHASKNVASKLLQKVDSQNLIRSDKWVSGVSTTIPLYANTNFKSDIQESIKKIHENSDLDALEHILTARDRDFKYLMDYADDLKTHVHGHEITCVMNRNINYTNICSFKCNFCAFSKGTGHSDLRGKPYNISHDEIARRTLEAIDRGATEVCLQGGIHPKYTGNTYLDIVKTIRSVSETVHIHAFSPLEIDHGRRTLNVSVEEFLLELKNAGLNSLPGTAAEILHDDIRAIICPDKLNSQEWADVIMAAHSVGLPTTSTMMFGHVENMSHVARHFGELKAIQNKTNGITEFVPLPFVASEAPIYMRGLSRPGPTFKESVLVHAAARIFFYDSIDNIQGSWVKMGLPGLKFLLSAGINDVGGILMNESITKAAGASFGQELNLADVDRIAKSLDLDLVQRNTLYQKLDSQISDLSKSQSIPLLPILNEYHKPSATI
ncbi:5-amino-6-(D-ribitylamino)uracil--L-tyrosine 4-hydroxyphenyl transferase CofH [Gammaproteobacteria bacterium]|nr:5-amino-6-(D-ribitylamino)uracil--L-tyrosine 4-hydroxyphenyl transferase CofH [Gammaproteobacteria bacterium]MDC0635945.1 5-amino-6-(D-ribitylamino)uracil--L-tyrosine 4-hydroxyphenyl transferase CofH [Gammaproteobacteria bacterium]